MKNKEIIKIEETDWYKSIVDDCRAILTERVWNSRSELIIGYGEVGERIFTDKNYQKYGKGNRAFNNRLFRDIGIGERNGYYCLEFYEKFIYKKFGDVCTAVQSLPVKEGKNISWNKIKILYLPKSREQKEIPLPKGKYQIIYADPAWRYWEGGEKNQSQHYNTMDIEKIRNLPISSLAADNCILFLWATRPILPEAIETMKYWGFEYSTVGFVWVKSKQDGTGFAFGNGNWTRANAEYCLIGTKGSIQRKDTTISEIIYSPREEHSKKPDIVRENIVKLVGKLPRIELFARQKVEGWESWGNQL